MLLKFPNKIFLPFITENNHVIIAHKKLYDFQINEFGEIISADHPNLKLLILNNSDEPLLKNILPKNLFEHHVNLDPTQIINICFNNIPKLEIKRNFLELTYLHPDSIAKPKLNFKELILPKDVFLENEDLKKEEFFKHGDKIEFKIQDPENGEESFSFSYGIPTKTYKIDFINENKKFGKETVVLGASSASGIMRTSSQHKSTLNWKFKISADDKEEEFTINLIKPRTSKKEFNSLKTLYNAMSTVDWLLVKLYDSTLFIALKDYYSEINFQDIKGHFTKEVGLKNIQGWNDSRFASLNALHDLLKNNDNFIIEENEGLLKIAPKNPLSSMEISISPKHKMQMLEKRFTLEDNKLLPSYETEVTEDSRSFFSGDIEPQLKHVSHFINLQGKKELLTFAMAKISDDELVYEIFTENSLLKTGRIYINLENEIIDIEHGFNQEIIIDEQKLKINLHEKNCNSFLQEISIDGIAAETFKRAFINEDGEILVEYPSKHIIRTGKLMQAHFLNEEFLSAHEDYENFYNYNFATGLPEFTNIETVQAIGEVNFGAENGTNQ